MNRDFHTQFFSSSNHSTQFHTRTHAHTSFSLSIRISKIFLRPFFIRNKTQNDFIHFFYFFAKKIARQTKKQSIQIRANIFVILFFRFFFFLLFSSLFFWPYIICSRLNSSGAWRHSMTRDLGTDIDSVFSPPRTGATLPKGEYPSIHFSM